GADIVKVPYTGDPESFSRVVEGSPIPVVIAGGPKMKTEREVLEMVYGAMQAGAKGLSIGRNVFQAKNRVAMVRALSLIVHEGKSVEEAIKILE
ncbi:MAG: fructose-bisphosphate aldolase, partial [Aquificaceae bacterium]